MSVFRNYDSKQAGGVNANAFPRMYPQPWTPTQRNVRSNPNIPSQPQRIQPHERGTFYPTSASGGGTLAPSMSSGGCGCGGGCNGNSTPTAVDVATGHSFPGVRLSGGSPVAPHTNMAPALPPRIRVQSRGTGALRATPTTGTVRMSGTPVRLVAGGLSNRRSGL